MINPLAQAYNYVIHVIFRNKIGQSDDFGLRNPVNQKKKIAEMCYLYPYRRTPLPTP